MLKCWQATSLRFADVHAEGKPAEISAQTVFGRSYNLSHVVQHMLHVNSSAVIAIKLDIEGETTLPCLPASSRILHSVRPSTLSRARFHFCD